MEVQNAESVDPSRTVLQSYLEVLYLCLDHSSNWTASDLHAAFEWSLALHKISLDVERAAALARIAQELRPELPPSLQGHLDDALSGPSELLLRCLLLRPVPGATWALKVLGSHTSACALPEPCLAADVATAVARVRERQACAALLQAAAAPPPPEAVRKLASAAPTWLPSSAEAAAEHAAYFSSERALELATAAAALRQRCSSSGAAAALAAVRDEAGDGAQPGTASAELLAMALCLPEPPPSGAAAGPSGARQEGQEPRQRLVRGKGESVIDPMAQAFAVELRERPALAVTLPPPLVGRACRTSFPAAVEVKAALDAINQSQEAPLQAQIACLRQLCLADDATAAFFRTDLLAAFALV